MRKRVSWATKSYRVNIEEPFLVARVDSAANKFEMNVAELPRRLRAQRVRSKQPE